jgi:hypothetical protein
VVHFIVLILLGLTGNSVGLMGGCIFKDPKVASGVVPMFFMPIILFSGYLQISRDNVGLDRVVLVY